MFPGVSADDAGEPADPLREAWEKVDRAWDDPEAHRRFLALCRALGRLPEAGRRYREVREADPSRAASAEAQIDALLAAAMIEMQAHRAPPPAASARRWLTGAALVLLLALLGFFMLAVERIR
jgi:hypothetical protein